MPDINPKRYKHARKYNNHWLSHLGETILAVLLLAMFLFAGIVLYVAESY